MALIRQYRDLGLGLADASVVATAERLGRPRLLTVDERHFRAIQPLRIGVNACSQQCVRHETSFGSKTINPSSVAAWLSSSSDETRTIVSVCCSNRYEFVKAAVPSWIAS